MVGDFVDRYDRAGDVCADVVDDHLEQAAARERDQPASHGVISYHLEKANHALLHGGGESRQGRKVPQESIDGADLGAPVSNRSGTGIVTEAEAGNRGDRNDLPRGDKWINTAPKARVTGVYYRVTAIRGEVAHP